ncbi:MAG TPA: hypothetical protein VMM12_06315 [Longimicrobiales bacterium]|nr:hypothetical protein [Longimicrobiales bacterium]
MLLALYVVLVIALPLALGLLVALNGLPRTRRCPHCTAETFRIRSRGTALLALALRPEELHARWCPACGWTGKVRLARTACVPARPARAPAPHAAGSVRGPGVELRRLELPDGAWRVQLECWADAGTWQGRLLFVGPEGRAWTDGRPLLTGGSALEVLSQVLSLSDRALAGRIRKATR